MTTCPRCDSARVNREERRVKRTAGGWECWTYAGWWACTDCWHKWDGITDSGDGVLPDGVVARGKPIIRITKENTE